MGVSCFRVKASQICSQPLSLQNYLVNEHRARTRIVFRTSNISECTKKKHSTKDTARYYTKFRHFGCERTDFTTGILTYLQSSRQEFNSSLETDR